MKPRSLKLSLPRRRFTRFTRRKTQRLQFSCILCVVERLNFAQTYENLKSFNDFRANRGGKTFINRWWSIDDTCYERREINNRTRCGRYIRIILLSRTSLRTIFARYQSLRISLAWIIFIASLVLSLLTGHPRHALFMWRSEYNDITESYDHGGIVPLVCPGFPPFPFEFPKPGLRIPVPWLSKSLSETVFVLCSLSSGLTFRGQEVSCFALSASNCFLPF